MSDFDSIEYEILEDGTIKWSTDEVSAPNHSSAEQFLRMVRRLAGGESKRTKRVDHKHAQQHVHVHDEEVL